MTEEISFRQLCVPRVCYASNSCIFQQDFKAAILKGGIPRRAAMSAEIFFRSTLRSSRLCGFRRIRLVAAPRRCVSAVDYVAQFDSCTRTTL
jgi:hypothetical protein